MTKTPAQGTPGTAVDTNAATGLMQKRIVDLTEADRLKLAKLIGTSGKPFPMMRQRRSVEGGTTIVKNVLGSVESDRKPMVFYSDMRFNEVEGLLSRDLPLPSMLHILEETARLAAPESKRRILTVLGEPGDGKSYLAKSLGRLMHPEGALVVDCGGKNMNDLLYETVLDLNNSRTFKNELDQRLATGNISPLALNLLESELGTAFSRDGAVGHIDWQAIGEHSYQDYKQEDQKSWPSRHDRIVRVHEALKRVSQIEGLDKMGGNSLGLASQEGALIRAFKARRPILLDEYTKSREGGDDQLAIVLQFLNGEIDECTVENKFKEKGDAAGQSFTFRRADTGLGFFAMLTGNLKEDGSSTRELSKSVYSRLTPIFLTEKTELDWQHRICQCLTGVPISTWYYMNRKQWDENKDGFTKFLIHKRMEGLTEEQKKNVPAFQIAQLRNWQNVLNASHKLAIFYSGWRDRVNPDSELLRQGGFGEVLLEIDPTYTDRMAVDLRKVVEFLPRAMWLRPEVVEPSESGGFDLGRLEEAPKVRLNNIHKEDPALGFGTRLTDVLLSHIANTTAGLGKHALYKHMMQLAANCGLIEIELKEGQKSGNKTIAELLNINLWQHGDMTDQARLVRDMLCEDLKTRDSKIKAANDEIMSVRQVEAVMAQLEEITSHAKDSRQNVLLIPNRNSETLDVEPFTTTVTHDAVQQDGTLLPLPAPQALIERDLLLLTLAMPRIGNYNLAGLWTNGLNRNVSSTPQAAADPVIKIAEAHSGSPVGLTTVMVQSHDKSGQAVFEPLHILHETAKGRTMIVGGAIPSALSETLRYRNIVYIDRHAQSAKTDIESTIRSFIGSKSTELYDHLRMAHLLRNMEMTDAIGDVFKLSLGDIMTSPAFAAKAPHYLLNRPEMPPDAAQPESGPKRPANNNDVANDKPRLIG